MNAAAFYEVVADSYESPENEAFYRETTRALLDLVPSNHPIESILEIGAGTGFSTLELKTRFPKAAITALEPSGAMLAKAKARIDGIEWLQQPLGDFSSDTPFDFVICSVAAHWFSSSELTKLELLAKNSLIALALPMPASDGGTGNDILKKLVFAMKPRHNWPKETRHAEKFVDRLQNNSLLIESADLRISERYNNLQEFAGNLYTRGALMALFGDHAEIAANRLSTDRKYAEFLEPISFTWRFKLVVLKGKGVTSCTEFQRPRSKST